MLFRLAWIALLQVLMVDLAAVLPGESARLWLPFLPLLMIPIAAELAIWPTLHRAILYACLLVITFSLAQYDLRLRRSRNRWSAAVLSSLPITEKTGTDAEDQSGSGRRTGPMNLPSARVTWKSRFH